MNFRKSICGTYEYMSPEIINNKQYTNKIDIWCLGILLYEMLHGKAPYTAVNMTQIKREFEEKNIQINKNLPVKVKDLLKKILRFNEKDRYDINQILQHDAISEFKPGFEKKLTKDEIKLLIRNYQMSCDFNEDRIPENLLKLAKQDLVKIKMSYKNFFDSDQDEFFNVGMNFEDFKNERIDFFQSQTEGKHEKVKYFSKKKIPVEINQENEKQTLPQIKPALKSGRDNLPGIDQMNKASTFINANYNFKKIYKPVKPLHPMTKSNTAFENPQKMNQIKKPSKSHKGMIFIDYKKYAN